MNGIPYARHPLSDASWLPAPMSLTLRQLFIDNAERLSFNWVSGQAAGDAPLSARDSTQPQAPDLVGNLNLIHANRIQVLGMIEARYLEQQPADAVWALLHHLCADKTAAFLVADGLPIPPILNTFCAAGEVPLLTSPHPAVQVLDVLRYYFARVLARSVSLHGVFLDILELGVLITGESGMGKSELALELISRGHGLVADDVVEVHRIAPDLLEGRCPPMLRDFLEVRGIEILNIRTIFGETAVRLKKALRLIVHLEMMDANQAPPRLALQAETEVILDVPIRKIRLPVAAGRNLAVLTEAAVRNHILQLRGIDSTQELIDRQRQMLSSPGGRHTL